MPLYTVTSRDFVLCVGWAIDRFGVTRDTLQMVPFAVRSRAGVVRYIAMAGWRYDLAGAGQMQARPRPVCVLANS